MGSSLTWRSITDAQRTRLGVSGAQGAEGLQKKLVSEPRGKWCRTEPVGPPGYRGQRETARTRAAHRKLRFILEARGSLESILNREMTW